MSEINGYQLTAKWFEFCKSGNQNIRPIHTSLYLYCIYVCNSLRWKTQFGLPTEFTMQTLGISSYKTYKNTLQDLIDFGFITLINKSYNQHSSNIIALVKNTKASPKQIPKQVQSNVGIVKQLKTSKNSSKVLTTTGKDDILLLMQRLRNDITESILHEQRKEFEIKYPNKNIISDRNLIISWCNKIAYTDPQTEFNKTAANNKAKYG